MIEPQPPDSVGGSKSQSSTQQVYHRIYYCLKSQRTTFETLNQVVNRLTPETTDDKKAIEMFKSSLSQILDSSYGLLFQLSYNFAASVNTLLTEKLTPSIEKVGYQILSACLSINRLIPLLSRSNFSGSFSDDDHQFNFSASGSPISPPSFSDPSVPTANSQSSDSDTVICRICEKKIPLSMIEEHSKMCEVAYLSSQTMMTTDEKMKKLQIRTQEHLLKIHWPGNEQNVIDTVIPILHIIALLDNAIKIDNNSSGSFEELESIKDSFNLVNVPVSSPELSIIYSEALVLLDEKIKASNKLSEAMDFVEKTTSEKLCIRETTIADFQFLKRISSGAYAQVFLAKRSATNDLIAVKVISKSSIQRKNDRQRILLEKNILEQVTCPYMTQFCMF